MQNTKIPVKYEKQYQDALLQFMSASAKNWHPDLASECAKQASKFAIEYIEQLKKVEYDLSPEQ